MDVGARAGVSKHFEADAFAMHLGYINGPSTTFTIVFVPYFGVD